MGISQGSWLNEEWIAKDKFSSSKEKFHSVYDPLKDACYEKEKVWNPKKKENFYHITLPEDAKYDSREFIITKSDMIRSLKYKSDFENLRKSIKRDLTPGEIIMFRTTMDELKDMEKMIKEIDEDDI